MKCLSLEELALQAEADVQYVRRLIELGVVEAGIGSEPYGPEDVRRVQLLATWEAAGFPVEAVVELIRAGEFSVSWLDAAVMTQAERSDVTYEQLCREEGVPLALVRALQAALGFPPPEADDCAWDGDRDLVGLVGTLLAAGTHQAAVLGLVRVYADSLRRVAKAEAELYESEIEPPLRCSGRSEQDIMDDDVRFSDRVIGSLERALVGIYRRHREHVWTEHCITHAEWALERAGLCHRNPRPPAICFVDLTGYTRITDERGDKVAAQLATDFACLVEDISRRHGGRPIRWLGDGGMFHFKEVGPAVLSSLDMVDRAPSVGLPPVHIGIHTGPVIFQDGDVYGRTVNLASRIASYAGPGQVLATDEAVGHCGDAGVRFAPLGPVSLKGISMPVTLHRAVRDPQPNHSLGPWTRGPDRRHQAAA